MIRIRNAAAWVAALLVLTAGRAASQGRWIGTGGLGYVEQRVDAGYGLEEFSGLALEFGVEGRLSSRLAITLRGLGGELQSADAADLDRRIGEAEALASYTLASVWGFYGGVTLRRFRATPAGSTGSSAGSVRKFGPRSAAGDCTRSDGLA